MNQIAYVDVDDTLVRSVGTTRIPMVDVIRHVRALKEGGWELYCWSSGGAEYARESALELKIEDCFVAFLPKPSVMIDDVSPESWSFLKIVHPRQINEPIQSVQTRTTSGPV